MIHRLNGDQLRDATDDDPLVRASVLGGRISGLAWSGYGAFAWQGVHRAEPSFTGIGSPEGAARLMEVVVGDHPELRHASLPRGWVEHVSPGLVERKADWDWFWTEKSPEPRPHAPPVRWLPAEELPEVRALLTEAMPDAAAWPGDARARRWAGIRDAELRLVACAADTSRNAAVGHLSSVATAPDQRRKGHAGTLVTWLTGQYLDEGAELVTLGMYAENTAGRRLYDQLGFTCQHEFTGARIIHQ